MLFISHIDTEGTGACFVGGEDRNTENLALLSVHTLFLREHNRLADALRSRHGNWNDELLYQEARRINIAQIQNIIYNVFTMYLQFIHLHSKWEILNISTNFTESDDSLGMVTTCDWIKS